MNPFGLQLIKWNRNSHDLHCTSFYVELRPGRHEYYIGCMVNVLETLSVEKSA